VGGDSGSGRSEAVTGWWIKGSQSFDWPNRPAPVPEAEGDAWAPPPEAVVWVRRDDLPYVVGVEFLRTEEGTVHPVGVSVRVMAPHPFPRDTEVDLPPLSARVVRRLPLGSYVDAAVAWASHPLFVLRNVAAPDEAWDEVRRAVAPRGRPSYNTDFYAEIAEIHRALTIKGKRPVPEIARRKRVSPNTVHQWIYRARQLGLLEKPVRRTRR
jgi:hypothetical protein